MAAILTTKEDAQGFEENINPKNFYLQFDCPNGTDLFVTVELEK